jgi:hypothetical protein
MEEKEEDKNRNTPRSECGGGQLIVILFAGGCWRDLESMSGPRAAVGGEKRERERERERDAFRYYMLSSFSSSSWTSSSRRRHHSRIIIRQLHPELI